MSMSELEVLAHIDRGMLYSFVWSIPPEVLAERMHVSVDAIQRSCANRGIPPLILKMSQGTSLSRATCATTVARSLQHTLARRRSSLRLCQ